MTTAITSIPRYQPKYHTIAHEFLALNEVPTGALDNLLLDTEKEIQVKEYSENEILPILKKLERLLTESKPETASFSFLNKRQWEEQELYLDLMAGPLAYAAIAEALNLPFVAVNSASLLISWKISDKDYNTYSILGNEIEKEPQDITAEESLDKNKVLASYYNNIGLAWANKKEVPRAITCFDKAIKLNPQYATAYHNRSIAYHKIGEKEKAIDDACMAFELQ